MTTYAPNRVVNTVKLESIGYGMHRDDYTVTDKLDRRALVRTITEVIAKDRAPQVFGLHGDWGSGKTSALRAIRYHLTGEDVFGEKPDDWWVACILATSSRSGSRHGATRMKPHRWWR